MTWESQAIAMLTASLVRPFVLAAAARLILRLLRIRHPASRHAVWTAVLIGMLLLPFASILAPHWKLPLLPAKARPALRSIAASPVSPLDSDEPQAANPGELLSAKSSTNFHLPAAQTLILACYLAGLLAMLAYRMIGWALLWRVISRSKPVRAGWLLESADVLTPVAVGVLRPAVLLPAGWRAWEASTRRAVLAHEFAHLRRGDALVSALARVTQCVLWFHPLAWWVSRKTSDLAELACDAAALERVDDPAGYARILLQFTDAVNRAGRRVSLPGLAMASASASGMGRRIDQVFELSNGTMRRLSRPAIVLVLLGTPVMCFAAMIALGEQSAPEPAPGAQPASPSEPTPIPTAQPAPVLSRPMPKPAPEQQVLPRSPEPPPQSAAPAPAAPQKFDVVSIKPCAASEPGGRGGRGGGRGSSPGRVSLNCRTVASLIEDAYVRFAEGRRNLDVRAISVEGGPNWINSERYQINAEVEGAPTREMMNGPMLQAILQDRFQLKTHRETKEVSVYVLRVAKGGLKLRPTEEGGCRVLDLSNPQPPKPGDKPMCGSAFFAKKPPNIAGHMTGTTLDQIAGWFAQIMDIRVINETGVAGAFDVDVEFIQDETIRRLLTLPAVQPPAESTDPLGPSLFTAVQDQLGLKLDSVKRPGQSLVIDQIERPTEN